MYKQEKIVVEDAVVGKNCPGSKHYFTGSGKSKLELPVTISFLDEGKYTVHITEGHIFVDRVEDEITKEKAKDPAIAVIEYRINEINNALEMPLSENDRRSLLLELDTLENTLISNGGYRYG